MGHKSANITLKVYAKAYKVLKDKNLQKKWASFLDDWHKSGTANIPIYDKPQKIGENMWKFEFIMITLLVLQLPEIVGNKGFYF